MRTSPTTALETLLGLLPLHLHLEAEGRAGIYRTQCSYQWKPGSSRSGHVCITQDMETDPILQMGSEKLILRYVYEKTSRSDTLTGVNGKTGFGPIEKVN
jgi:hypothetical protein